MKNHNSPTAGIEAISASLLSRNIEHVVVTPSGVAYAGIFRGHSAAEVRQVKDNKLVTVIEESYPISVRDYIKKVCNVANTLAELKSEECYVYWNNVRYRPGKDELETDKNYALKYHRGAYAAAEVPSFKLVCKDKILEGADHAIFDLSESGQLRARYSIEDPTILKIRNMITKGLKAGRIESFSKPGYVFNVRITKYGQPEKGQGPVNVFNLGAGTDRTERYTIRIVNSKQQPVYSIDDITPVLTLELTPVKQ